MKRLYRNLLFAAPESPKPLGMGEVVLGEHGALLEWYFGGRPLENKRQ